MEEGIPLKATRICKVCGIEYPFCKTERPNGTFIYQEVACCKEHAKEYFAKIAASRQSESNIKTEETPVSQEEKIKEIPIKQKENIKEEINDVTSGTELILEDGEIVDIVDDEDFYDDDEYLDEDDE